MKTGSKIILAVLVAAAALTVIYRLMNVAPSDDLSADKQMIGIIGSSGCMACHTENPELPFYSDFPVVGKLVKEDIASGYDLLTCRKCWKWSKTVEKYPK